jgi:hypothetical protein
MYASKGSEFDDVFSTTTTIDTAQRQATNAELVRQELEAQISKLQMQQHTLPNMDLNKIFSDTFARAGGPTGIPALTPSGMPQVCVGALAQEIQTVNSQPATSTSARGGKRKLEETSEERTARIRLRNRDHARKCRIRKRQAAESLNERASQLEHENNILKTAFRALHNHKALVESVVVSEFGERGMAIIERSRQSKLEKSSSGDQQCELSEANLNAKNASSSTGSSLSGEGSMTSSLDTKHGTSSTGSSLNGEGSMTSSLDSVTK